MPKTYTDLQNYSLELYGTNILYLRYLDNADISLDIIMEINDHGMDLMNRQPFYSVVDLRNMYGNMSDEAKEFVAKNEEVNRLRICESLLVNNLPMRLLVKGYLQFNKPASETKAFSKIHLCSLWLQEKGCSIDNINLMKQSLEEYHD